MAKAMLSSSMVLSLYVLFVACTRHRNGQSGAGVVNSNRATGAMGSSAWLIVRTGAPIDFRLVLAKN